MRILGIETSCDETAAAVVEDGRRVLSDVVASQVEVHARYGGVVPEVASRQHLLAIIPILSRALERSGIRPHHLAGIAVTAGPGLPGSLLVGLNLAKALALVYRLPLIGINHLEAHIYAHWLEGREPRFPALCLIVSGGHTELLIMRDHGDLEPLGRTRDDAAGEAFDKAARLLGLGYPGGPAIEKAAAGNHPAPLPRAWLKGTWDFSFSGLKTALLRMVQRGTAYSVAELAAGFEEAVVEVLAAKTIEAALEFNVKEILVSGGVAANRRLRERFRRSPVPVYFPSPHLCTDNAAMVAACGYFHLRMGKTHELDLDIYPDWPPGRPPS